jgi:ankyrin repeat protein
MSELKSRDGDISLDTVYTKFFNDEKKYGHVDSVYNQLLSRLHILRVNVSPKAAAKAYNFHQEEGKGAPFYSDASKTLFMVCDYKHVKYYQIGELLKCKADPNVQLDETGDTASHKLIRSGGDVSIDIVLSIYLLDSVKDDSVKILPDYSYMLQLNSKHLYTGNVECVKLLVEWGADVTKCNFSGRNALHVACDLLVETKNQMQIVQFLLENRRIDINIRDENGLSAGMIAVSRSSIWILRALLLRRISVKMKSTMINNVNTLNMEKIDLNSFNVIDISKSLLRSTTFEVERSGIYDRTERFIKVRKSHYESKLSLWLESIWFNKVDLCYQMILRRDKEEIREIKNETNRLVRIDTLNKKYGRNMDILVPSSSITRRSPSRRHNTDTGDMDTDKEDGLRGTLGVGIETSSLGM